MKKAGVLGVLMLIAASLALAQGPKTVTLKGFVVDQMCAKTLAKKEGVMEKAGGHTKKCALEEGCAESGFGLFSEGKYYRFDEKGSAKAKDLIEGSKREKELMFEATGSVDGDLLTVKSLKELSREGKTEKGEKPKS
jgi:hypothetical protein